MWQVQLTLAMRRCIWQEASVDPVERAVPRNIKVTAATRELSPHPDFNTRRLYIRRSRALHGHIRVGRIPHS